MFNQTQTLLGKGAQANVYYHEGFAYKVYRDDYPQESIENERANFVAVAKTDLPIPHCYPYEDKRVLKMNYIEGITLLERMQNEDYKQGVIDLLTLQRKIHSCSCINIRSFKEWAIEELNNWDDFTKERKIALEYIEFIKEEQCLLHFDFHFMNVICTKEGYAIVDWNNAKIGNPIYDYARTYVLLSEYSDDISQIYIEMIEERKDIDTAHLEKAIFVIALLRIKEFESEKARKWVHVFYNKIASQSLAQYTKKVSDSFAAEENLSGVVRLTRHGDVLYEQAYGYANRAFHIPNNMDTRFDTASITKVFTAVAVLQLVEQGKFALDDKITELIDLSGTKIPEDVTVEQLLNHTSGIADDADEEAGENYADLFVNSPNYAIRNCADFLKNFAYKEPNFKAGTDVRYCNCTFVLLGLAIEKVTGISYRDYVRKHVFAKAGMSHTDFYAMDEINENVAEGYPSVYGEDGTLIGYKKNIYCYPPIGTPDGGAYTTAGDLECFMKALNQEELLSKKYEEMIHQPHCAFEKNKDWYEIEGMKEQNGYGFEFFLVDGKPFCMYKDGCNDGVAGMLSYYPSVDMCLVILANQDCNVWEMRKRIQLEWDRWYGKG